MQGWCYAHRPRVSYSTIDEYVDHVRNCRATFARPNGSSISLPGAGPHAWEWYPFVELLSPARRRALMAAVIHVETGPRRETPA